MVKLYLHSLKHHDLFVQDHILKSCLRLQARETVSDNCNFVSMNVYLKDNGVCLQDKLCQFMRENNSWLLGIHRLHF